MQPEITDLVLEGLKDGSVSRERAVKILRRLKERVPVAVIGIGARVADTDDYQDVWATVREQRSYVGRAPRVRGEQVAPVAPPGTCAAPNQYSKGSFIDDIQYFDHDVFGFDAEAARHLFPHARLVFQTAFRALEDAGLMGEYGQRHRTGVYAGYNYTKDQIQSYLGLAMRNSQYADPLGEMLGNWSSGMVTRLASRFDLRGPAYVVDASCPSSMVAMIAACEAVRSGSCDTALAGGLYLDLTPVKMFNRPGLFVAPDESIVTKLFDRRNAGAYHGEYVGFVVVKRLDRALADGDLVHGVIHGWSHNNNGADGAFDRSAPRGVARAMEDLIRSSGIEAEDIGLVIGEGYANSTEEAMETVGLADGIRRFTKRTQFCAMTALTPNLGYLHSAIGIANLTVLLQALRDRRIPALPHYDTPTEMMNLADSPFYIPTELEEWAPGTGGGRVGVVYSYGFGGTNTLLAVGPAPVPTDAPPEGDATEAGAHPGRVLPYLVSATSAESFAAQLSADLAFIERAGDRDFATLCYASACRRFQHSRHRLAITARDRAELVETLRAHLAGATGPANMWEGRDLPDRSHRARRPLGERSAEDAAAAFARGEAVELTELFTERERRMVRLPRYRLSPVRCWVDPVPVRTRDRARMVLGLLAARRSSRKAS